MAEKGVRKVCSRGHVFYKSSLCPACPVCWPAQAKKLQGDFPKTSAPALRALHHAKIKNLKTLSTWKKADVAALHGMGPKALGILAQALRAKKLSFKK